MNFGILLNSKKEDESKVCTDFWKHLCFPSFGQRYIDTIPK